MVIYADLIFLINTILDILLFSAYRSMTGAKTRMIKIIAVSALGGVYAVFESALGISAYLRPLALMGMCALIWGRGGALRSTAGLLFVMVCVHGITVVLLALMGADASLAEGTLLSPGLAALPAVLLAYALYAAANFYTRKRGVYKRAVLRIKGKRISLKLLHDSGNLLKYKNKTVMIVSYGALGEDEDYNAFFGRSEAFLRYKTIAGEGIIPVIEPEKCRIDGSEHDIAVAVVKDGFNGSYQGIIGTLSL